jgi:hypothetical protein
VGGVGYGLKIVPKMFPLLPFKIINSVHYFLFNADIFKRTISILVNWHIAF